MHKKVINFKDTPFFSSIFKAFIDRSESLNELISPSIDDLDLSQFNISLEKRQDLIEVIKDQANDSFSNSSLYNLNLLKEENTYTVTTGHQLNLMGGPLFFTYKILATVRACQELTKKYPDANFVPIYWAATEDHDYEEINHFFLFGKKQEWSKTSDKTPVGRLKLEDLDFISDEIPEEFRSCYTASNTLREAHIKLVYQLFSGYGLLVLDADDDRLKKTFVPTALKDLKDSLVQQSVLKTNEQLESLGYHPQVNPRAVNLFAITDSNERYRLDKEENRIQLVDSDQSYSLEEIETILKKNPSFISPNVLMRPLYQQQILPNVAYIGGPGEMAYWLQLRSMFNSFDIPFPALIPRFFALYLSKGLVKKMDKADLTITDLFKSKEELRKELLSQDEEGIELLSRLEKEFEDYKEQLLSGLKDQLNQSLISYTESALTRMKKEHQNILKKVKKEIENRNSVQLNRINGVLDSLFPDGGLQERTESVFTFLINQPDFISNVFDQIDPFDFRFNVLSEE